MGDGSGGIGVGGGDAQAGGAAVGVSACVGRGATATSAAPGFALSGDFALDVLERVPPVSVEVGVAECPALGEGQEGQREEGRRERAYVFAELVVVGVLDLRKDGSAGGRGCGVTRTKSRLARICARADGKSRTHAT